MEDQKVETKVSAEVKSSNGSGLSPEISALLCWLFSPLSGIIFLVIEKENKLIRFHAYESLLASAVIFVAMIISAILMVVLIGALLLPVVMLGGIVVWVMGMIKAYKGEMWKLPVIGDLAEKYVSK